MIKIAEIGINWDGDLEILLKMIEECKKSGADGVKLQYLKPTKMYPSDAKYKLPEGKKNIAEYLKEFTLNVNDIKQVKELTKKLDLLLGCTVTDVQSVQTLKPYVDFYKVASSSFNFVQLHEEINKTGKDCVLSTGGAKFHEIEKMVRYYNRSKITILHCNYEYPTAMKNVNLSKIEKLKKLGVKYGFSNHTKDFEILGPMCIAMGCDYFEAHVTHLKERKNIGDHHFSLTNQEFKKLCKSIDIANQVIGDQNVSLTEKEVKLRDFCYRKAFSRENISKGSRIKKDDILWLRNSGKPGVGFDPEEEYLLAGKIVKNDIKKGEKIQREDLF